MKLSFLLFILLGSIFSQDNIVDRINAVIQEEKLLGLSIAIVAEGEIIFKRGFGIRDWELQLPVNEQTNFRIASVSKTFTALSCMILKERGLLDLDEDISNYLGFTVRNPKYPDLKITTRQIASHTSSLNDGKTYDLFLTDSYNLTTGAKRPVMKDILSKNGEYYDQSNFLNKAPGRYFQYSNLGYGILGTIVEAVSQERFDEFVRKNILNPLGIYEASMNIDTLENLNNLAVIYRKKNGQWVPQTDNYKGEHPTPKDLSKYVIGTNALPFGPQGAMHITIPDLARYLISFVRMEILNPEGYLEMEKPQWFYDGTNGDSQGGLMQAYGIGIHTARGVDGQDWVFLRGEQTKGHPGFAYGLSSSLYFNEFADGVVFAINGCDGDYKDGEQSSFLRAEEKLFQVAEWYLEQQGYRNNLIITQ